jgi:hypothetical protein
MFDLSGLSVKSPDARVAFGFDLAHLSAIPTAEAPAPQPSSINLRATQVAGSPATEFISPRVDAFAVCFESTLRRTMRFPLLTVPHRGGRFTD